MNRMVANSAVNSSAPSIGASSLVTDANSALSGGSHHLQRSASINTESYPRLPASPMSFSSNISGSSVMDGSSIVQQGSHQDQTQKQGASTATSQPTFQESGSMSQVQKKPRLDTGQEDILQQQVIQQLLQRQDPLQLQGQINPQLQALIQQQKLLQQRQQQQQILQSLPPIQRAHMQQQQQQQQQQLRQQLQQQMMQATHSRFPVDSGICARRLMQYIYHQHHRPPDNNILYWRKFVKEYFAPHAKRRWCLSLYDNVGNHTLGAFPQASMDAWHCNICGSKSGKGFEASVEVLPRLNKIKFDSGVIDELLFLDMPHEYRLSSGIMLLEYAKATLESVYERLRVVREGQLRIVFTPDLKILSWDFCAQHHEELLPRRLVSPQVNQLLQVAQKYQRAVTESGSAGVSSQDLLTNLNMFMTAGHQLARNLELQSLNDLGFSKRYVRCLQISEVVNCMKDLIDFSRDHNVGAIDSLKTYPHHAAMKFQNQKMPEVEQLVNDQTTDQNALTKMMAMHPGLSNHMINSFNQTGSRVPNNPAQGAIALNNYQRQNSVNSNSSSLQHNVSTLSGPNQLQSTVSLQCPALIQGSLRNAFVNSLVGPHQQPPQQTVSGVSVQLNNAQPPQVNQPLQQQHIIQQLLQEMRNNNRGAPKQALSAPVANGNASEEVFGGGISSSGAFPTRAPKGSVGNVSFGNGADMSKAAGAILSRNSSFKSISSNQTPIGRSVLNLTADVPESIGLPDLVQEISQDFADNGILSGKGGDMVYGWKS